MEENLATSLFRRELGHGLNFKAKTTLHQHAGKCDSSYYYKRHFGYLNRKFNLPLKGTLESTEAAHDSDSDNYEVYDSFSQEIISNAVYDMSFSPHNPNLCAASDDEGYIHLISTNYNNSKVIAARQCHNSALFSISWSNYDRGLLATGSGDTTVSLWDISPSGYMTQLKEFSGHTDTVKTVKFQPHSKSVLGSGGRDCCIMIWDTRCSLNSPQDFITAAHVSNENMPVDDANTVTDIVFQDDHTLLSCGSTDGRIKEWDLRKTYKYLEIENAVRCFEYPEELLIKGYSSLKLDQANNLYACSIGREIFKFNLNCTSSGLPDCAYQTHDKMSYYVKIDISGCGRYLVCGSDTNRIRIYDTLSKSAITKLPFPEMDDLDVSVDKIWAFLTLYTMDHSIHNCVLFSPIDPLKVLLGGVSGVSIWKAELPAHETKFKSRIKTPLAWKILDRSMKTINSSGNLFYPPYKIKPLVSSDSVVSSKLTVDLPNYIMDGILPHLNSEPCNNKIFSAYKKRISNKSNWLTKISLKYQRPATTDDIVNITDSNDGENRKSTNLTATTSI